MICSVCATEYDPAVAEQEFNASNKGLAPIKYKELDAPYCTDCALAMAASLWLEGTREMDEEEAELEEGMASIDFMSFLNF